MHSSTAAVVAALPDLPRPSPAASSPGCAAPASASTPPGSPAASNRGSAAVPWVCSEQPPAPQVLAAAFSALAAPSSAQLLAEDWLPVSPLASLPAWLLPQASLPLAALWLLVWISTSHCLHSHAHGNEQVSNTMAVGSKRRSACARAWRKSEANAALGMLDGLCAAAPAIACITSPFVTMPPGPLGVTSSADRPAPCNRSCAAGPILLLRGTSGALLEASSSSPPAAPDSITAFDWCASNGTLWGQHHHDALSKHGDCS